MLTMEVKSGYLRENVRGKSRHHIRQQMLSELNWKINQIQEEHTKYYKTLLKTREPNNGCKRKIEEEINKKRQK